MPNARCFPIKWTPVSPSRATTPPNSPTPSSPLKQKPTPFNSVSTALPESSELLIPLKNIPRINLLLHIVQGRVISIGYDSLALLLENFEVIDYFASEERSPVIQCGLVNNHLGTFGLDKILWNIVEVGKELLSVLG